MTPARPSFMTANFVARELGWHMADWGEGDRATQAAFRPIETFGERFAALLDDVADLGFGAIDLWEAHLSPAWATQAHVDATRRLLAERAMTVVSLAGWFGSRREEFAAACRLATALGATVLGGRTGLLPADRAWVASTLTTHGLRLGLENHPERSTDQVLDTIGRDRDATLGATIDTGWFATQGIDPVEAIESLAGRIVHVHLKDVAAVGLPHRTTAFGEGIVPLRGCIDALRHLGYEGGISVEHVPDDHDPREEVRRAREAVEGWLAA